MSNFAKRFAQKNILRREQYLRVKKMDRQQMEEFCRNLYMSGYEDGRESVPGIDIKQIEEAVAGTKGIGESRLRSIMNSIHKKFGTYGSEDDMRYEES